MNLGDERARAITRYDLRRCRLLLQRGVDGNIYDKRAVKVKTGFPPEDAAYEIPIVRVSHRTSPDSALIVEETRRLQTSFCCLQYSMRPTVSSFWSIFER